VVEDFAGPVEAHRAIRDALKMYRDLHR